MKRTLPPLAWFRSFEAAARHLSFTAAAEELGLTQSAISQQVRSLELRVGVELFRRMPRGLALTDEGRLLLPKVGSSLDQLTAAVAPYETAPRTDLLTIAASISIIRWVLAPRLKTFLVDFPEIKIRLLGTTWPDDFKTSLADVEIRFGSEKQVGKNAERLQPDRLIAVARSDHTDPVDQTLLIDTVGTSQGWQHWAAQEGTDQQLVPSIHVDTYGAALDMAVCGTGIALTSSLLATGLIRDGHLKQFGDTQLHSTEGYFLEVRSNTSAAVAFGNWIKTVIASRYPQ